jgi:hypothetical protein
MPTSLHEAASDRRPKRAPRHASPLRQALSFAFQKRLKRFFEDCTREAEGATAGGGTRAEPEDHMQDLYLSILASPRKVDDVGTSQVFALAGRIARRHRRRLQAEASWSGTTRTRTA